MRQRRNSNEQTKALRQPVSVRCSVLLLPLRQRCLELTLLLLIALMVNAMVAKSPDKNALCS